MKPSIFNKQVPLTGRDDLFLMNMFTDSQLVVSPDVAHLLERVGTDPELMETLSESEHAALRTLTEHGFVVENRDAEWSAVDRFFRDVREDASELRLTVLTTMQCNFACDYCFQGDHGDYNATADKMSLETADRLCHWAELQLDELGSSQFGLTFFGGEPLLNQPVMYAMAERLWRTTQKRGIDMRINVITNGLLLTPDVVDRLEPFGLHSIKITLDGDRDAHDRMRPLRGGQGTFDRIIANIRQVAHRCNIAIGGNFVEDTVDSYPALLDYLSAQDFADRLVKVSFKPVIRDQPATTTSGLIPLTPVGADGGPLGGTCMTSAGSGTGSVCDSCNLLSAKMSDLREETKNTVSRPLTGCTWARATSTAVTRTRSVRTVRSTHAPVLPESGPQPSVTSATCSRSAIIARRLISSHWRPGRAAATAPSSRCAQAAAQSPHTPSRATSTNPPVTRTAWSRHWCRSHRRPQPN